jgi:putative ABC transport system ATP-binding protein
MSNARASGQVVQADAQALPPMVRLSHVSKSYQRGEEHLTVLDDLSLEVEPGDFVALMGPSGSGKSTLLNLVAGIDRADRGQVEVAGADLGQMDEGALADWRAAHVGFIFQFYNLLPVLSALENVELPLLLTRLGAHERRERAVRLLELVGLGDRLEHRPAQLSGGQQQRVAIARAVVTDPCLIVADEPTGDLDRNSGAEVLELLRQLNSSLGTTILMVTHDQHAAQAARRILTLDKGVLVGTSAIDGDADECSR